MENVKKTPTSTIVCNTLYSCTHTHMNTHKPCAYTCIQIHTHTYTYTHIHTHRYMYIHTHTHRCTNIHTHAHACTHTDTQHTHRWTHIHTHGHTQIQPPHTQTHTENSPFSHFTWVCVEMWLVCSC